MNDQKGHILILEQNPGTGRAACNVLQGDRFQTTVYNGRNGKHQRQISDYDLVLLEHQQRKQGCNLQILQKLRAASPIPIVVLSDEPNSKTRIEALEKGADDFLSRPYLGRELLARIKAILRRCRLSQLTEFEQGSHLEIDHRTQQVTLRGKAIDLTQREFEILDVLAQEPGRNFTRQEIMEVIWGAEYTGDQRRVDLYVSRIRAKMHQPHYEDLIRSIYGVGYRLEV